MVHYSMQAHGRVQGVNFRATTRAKAIELGIKGWVKNNPDGTVHIEAEGDEESMSSFLEWCKHGPPAANVTRLDYEEKPLEEYTTFDIK